MTSQQSVCLFSVWVWVRVCVCVSVICYRADEKETSVPASHHSARRLLYLLPESPCATDKCVRMHKQCEECLCVSYCWRQCRHSWEGCVLCNQQQSWPSALDFLSSSVLQREPKGEKETKTCLGDVRDFGFLGSRTPHFLLPPLKPRNKTPSDMHVGWSIFWSTNLHPLCPLIDWPQ